MPVYFFQALEGGPVKIGHSGDIEMRRRQLESVYGRPLVILKIVAGSQQEEAAFHERFAPYRIDKTEQFRPGPRLIEFLEGSPIVTGPDEEMTRLAMQFRLPDEDIALIDELRKVLYEEIGRPVTRSMVLSVALRELAANRLNEDAPCS